MSDSKPRIVCQFSCGAASAVATKLAMVQYGATHDVQIVNAFLANEHEDNRRFLADCQEWFGQEIHVLRDTKYGADIIQMVTRERFIKNRYGAPCTKLLKRRLLDTWKLPGDVMVFGYTAEEVDRLEDFRERNQDRPIIAPLIDRGLGKEDCKAMIQRADIELPMMYRLGYHNANCIGCVKGGEGYYRAIRQDFPEQFERLCKVQDELGPGSYCTATGRPTNGSRCATWRRPNPPKRRTAGPLVFLRDGRSRHHRQRIIKAEPLSRLPQL